jgi:hypothetical protein
MKHFLNTLKTSLFSAGILFFCTALSGATAQDIRTERVSFQRGSSSATIEGRVTGDETVDYLLNVRAGQYMNVSMASNNGSNYFNIMEPGEEYEAIFVGSTSGNQFEGTTAKSGDYRIRVYLMRNAARRGERGDYRLEMIVSGSGQSQGSGDAMVPGTNYNATGSLPCSLGNGRPTSMCDFGVVRRAPGDADVQITLPDGSMVIIYFAGGKAVGYDSSGAPKGAFSATMDNGLYIVRIGNERYEISEAAVYGG